MTDPAANLLRYGDLLEWSELGERALCGLIATGSLGGAELWPGGRRFYLREIARHVLFAAPLPSLPFGPEPEAELLRLWDVLAWTGLHKDQWRRIKAHGFPRVTLSGGHCHYRRHEIRTRVFHPLLPASWGERSTLNVQRSTSKDGTLPLAMKPTHTTPARC